MRVRLQKFLPLVLLALAMQVLAPVAAALAAGQAIADPLFNAAICHGTVDQDGARDRTDAPAAQAGACALCCLAQAGASFDAPAHAALSVPVRHVERVVWQVAEAPRLATPTVTSAQARAPPRMS
jgi:hypothetical protein